MTGRAQKLRPSSFMILKCPYCHIQRQKEFASRTIRRWGFYRRKSDGQILVRYRCFRCGKSFSAATSSPLYSQKKRTYNRRVVRLMTAGVSQRKAAKLLRLNAKTVIRKFRFAGALAREENRRWNLQFPLSEKVQFDDMETFEHTKLKPISITLAVEEESRRILGIECSSMPAKGGLAHLSRKKYGPRVDGRSPARVKMFEGLKELVNPFATFTSDSNPHYPKDLRRVFPKATHKTVKGGRAAVVGQGELKKLKYDPIFSLNHTCAMIRDNIKRLSRKTWCTTKRMPQLQINLELYALEHNRRLATP